MDKSMPLGTIYPTHLIAYTQPSPLLKYYMKNIKVRRPENTQW